MSMVLQWLTIPVSAVIQNKAVRYTVAVSILLAALCVVLALTLSTGPGHGPIAGSGTIWVN
jgi:hypothetical protein